MIFAMIGALIFGVIIGHLISKVRWLSKDVSKIKDVLKEKLNVTID